MLCVVEEQLSPIICGKVRRRLEHCRRVDCGGVEKVIIYIRRCRLAVSAIVRRAHIGGSAVQCQVIWIIDIFIKNIALRSDSVRHNVRCKRREALHNAIGDIPKWRMCEGRRNVLRRHR